MESRGPDRELQVGRAGPPVWMTCRRLLTADLYSRLPGIIVARSDRPLTTTRRCSQGWKASPTGRRSISTSTTSPGEVHRGRRSGRGRRRWRDLRPGGASGPAAWGCLQAERAVKCTWQRICPSQGHGGCSSACSAALSTPMKPVSRGARREARKTTNPSASCTRDETRCCGPGFGEPPSEPPAGLEPATYALQVRCATNCAKAARSGSAPPRPRQSHIEDMSSKSSTCVTAGQATIPLADTSPRWR